MVGDGAKHVPRNGLLFAESGAAAEASTAISTLHKSPTRLKGCYSISCTAVYLVTLQKDGKEREGGREDLLNLRPFVAGQGVFAVGP